MSRIVKTEQGSSQKGFGFGCCLMLPGKFPYLESMYHVLLMVTESPIGMSTDSRATLQQHVGIWVTTCFLFLVPTCQPPPAHNTPGWARGGVVCGFLPLLAIEKTSLGSGYTDYHSPRSLQDMGILTVGVNIAKDFNSSFKNCGMPFRIYNMASKYSEASQFYYKGLEQWIFKVENSVLTIIISVNESWL